MRKLTKVASIVAAVVTMGNMMSAVQANPAPPVAEPDRVVSLGVDSSTVFTGPNEWGHSTYYNLKIIDKNGALYSLGYPYEVFGSTTYSTDPTIKTALMAQGVPGTPTGPMPPRAATALFQDHNQTALLFDTGTSTFWYSFPQTWHDIRVSDNMDFKLNTQTITHVQNYALRSN